MTDNVKETLHVSVSPHIRARETTTSIMRDVVIALLLPCAAGIYTFGLPALAVILCSVGACVLAEWGYQKLMKKPVTISDLSAVVTGLILAVNLPPTVPLWIPILGGFFAILVVKQVYGGLGQNFMNPALAARAFLLLSFIGPMTTFPTRIRTFFQGADAVSTATPLAALKNNETIDWVRMLFDTHSGCIGEASAVAILLGAAYLLIRRTITLRIPLTYILSTVVFIVLIKLIDGSAAAIDVNYLVAQVCGGGLLLGAFFMANDYVTCPITPLGQLLYGILLGLLTALLRIVGNAAEGVSFAILIGNMITPLLERVTVPRPFGKERRAR